MRLGLMAIASSAARRAASGCLSASALVARVKYPNADDSDVSKVPLYTKTPSSIVSTGRTFMKG